MKHFLSRNIEKNSSAFTLVELMIVIAIIGILAASLFPSMTQYFSRARDTTRFSDLNKLAKAIDTYYVDKEIYPNNVADLGGPQPTNYASCISMSHWNCWGNPEPATDLNGIGRPMRLLPLTYLSKVPIDPKNFDDGDACSVRPNQRSYLYGYFSNNVSRGYILVTRLENIPGTDKIGAYTGTRLGCSGFANYGIVQGNGGLDLTVGIVGE